jgi:hypothetical protein
VRNTVRLVLELVNSSSRDGLLAGSAWKVIAEFNFLHVAIVLFVRLRARADRHEPGGEPLREKSCGLICGGTEEDTMEETPTIEEPLPI